MPAGRPTKAPEDRSPTSSLARGNNYETRKVNVEGEVTAPPLGIPKAHKNTVAMYNSLKKSGQAELFEPADWEYARFLMTIFDRAQISKISAVEQQNLFSGLESLLVSPGARRKLKIEVSRNEEQADTETLKNELGKIFRQRQKAKYEATA